MSFGKNLCRLTALLMVVSTIGLTTTAAYPVGAQETTTETGGALDVGAQSEQRYLDGMEDIVNRIPGVSAKTHAFVLVQEDRRILVFTDQEPRTGQATVQGTLVQADRLPNLGTTVMFAESVEVSTKGEPVSLSEVRSNPGEYHSDLIRVTATHEQISGLVEPPEGQVVQYQSTGQLTNTPSFQMDQPGNLGRWASLNLSDNELSQGADQEIDQRFSNDGLATVDFRDGQFWSNAEATVDGVLLYDEGSPALVVADRSYSGAELESTQALQKRGDELEGEIVTVESTLVGAQISTQETLIKVAQCAPDSVTVPMSPPLCVPVPTDTVVHAGVLVNGVPDDTTDMVAYAGLSNHHQNQPATQRRGTYRVTGRLISTQQLSGDLPEGYALLVYQMEKTGSLNIQTEALDRAKSYKSEVTSSLRAQVTTVRKETSKRAYREAVENTSGASESQEQTATPTPQPANLEVVNAELTLTELEPGQETAASVKIRNNGETTGTTTVKIDVEGGPIVTEDVRVAPGETETVRIGFDPGITGAATVRVNGQSIGTVTVTEKGGFSVPNFNGELLGVILFITAGITLLSGAVVEFLRGYKKEFSRDEVTTGRLPGMILFVTAGVSFLAGGWIYGPPTQAISVLGGLILGILAVIEGFRMLYQSL